MHYGGASWRVTGWAGVSCKIAGTKPGVKSAGISGLAERKLWSGVDWTGLN